MESKFKAKLSKLSIVLTILVNLLIILSCYIMLFREDLLKNTNQPPNIIKYFIVFFLIIVILITFLLHPKSYTINNSYIEINKPLYTKKIAISEIYDIKEIDYENLAIRSRLFASGGVWGYFGLFSSSKFGRINLETTNFNNLIFIINKNKKITILSPDNSTEFLEKTNSIIAKI